MKIRATVMAQVVRLKTQENCWSMRPAHQLIFAIKRLGLLNEAREKSESYIDQLHKWAIQNKYPALKKPRTYRQKARKQYLVSARKELVRKKSAKQSVSN